MERDAKLKNKIADNKSTTANTTANVSNNTSARLPLEKCNDKTKQQTDDSEVTMEWQDVAPYPEIL
jgi:hypothetical protein